jgi:hypothetical protein
VGDVAKVRFLDGIRFAAVIAATIPNDPSHSPQCTNDFQCPKVQHPRALADL